MTKKRSNSQTNEDESSYDGENHLVSSNADLTLQEKEIASTLRLVETTDQALELIDSLAGQRERFEGDPGDLFDQMDEMRQQLQAAWKEVLDQQETNQVEDDKDAQQAHPASSSQTKRKVPEDDDKFREAYVETMTEVLADPLDAMRQQYEQEMGGRDLDIDLLVDALQSGIDLLHPEEKMLFLEELNAMEQNEEAKGESIHTMERRKLGFE